MKQASAVDAAGTGHVVHVPLGDRRYDVIVGPDLIGQLDDLYEARFGDARCVIVTDTNVAEAQLTVAAAQLAQNGRLRDTVVLPAGESTKGFAHLQELSERLLAAGTERGDVVVALGGGVIGDLAGFAASVLRRGVRMLQLPTSLLAQVDSSVGGKTGINTPQGKNLIGAFHQPSLVLADISVLDTLPDRQMCAGYAEIVKYGLLGDRAFFNWLDDNADKVLARDREAVAYAVKRSVEMKAELVVRDETETGDRALLNLGHTFGHALESFTNYSDRLLHGEGVAIGTCLAFRYSERVGACPPQTAARVSAHIKAAGLPTRIQDIPGGDMPGANVLLEAMRQDKKVRKGQLTFILAHDIGDAYIARNVAPEDIHAFLAEQLDAD